MRWTRQHPHGAWFLLIGLFALLALFVTDIGLGASGSITGTKIALGSALIVGSAVLAVGLRAKSRRRAGRAAGVQ